MKTLITVLLTTILIIVFLTGCQGQYSSGMKTDLPRTRIYHQRADGLRIPTYIYTK